MDHSLWNKTFSQSAIPSFICPECQKGTLGLHGKIAMEEPVYSKAAHTRDDWEPDWAVKRFMMMLKCAVPSCGEIAVVCGDTAFEQVEDEDYGATLESDVTPEERVSCALYYSVSSKDA